MNLSLKFFLLPLFALTLATSTFATERCSDDAMNEVTLAEDRLGACEIPVRSALFQELRTRLKKAGTADAKYNQRLVNSMAKFYRYYYTDLLIYDENACVREQVKKFDRLRLAVLDAMVGCAAQ